VLAVGLIIALGLFGGNKQAPGSGTTAPPTGPQQLIVDTSKAPEANSFKQVAQALMRARPGDRILVRGPGVEEEWQNVEANHFPKGVTVEADISPGQYMTWQLPPSARDLKAVFNAANVDGLKFKGFAFDGQNRAENGIYMHSRCPGVVFEDCRIQNCKEAGIKLSNATGDSGRPITFRRMWLSGTPTTKAVVYLFASSSLASVKANQHVSFEKCIVEGPGAALTLVEGSADSVSFAQTRFCRSAEGFLLRPTKDTRWSHIALNSNTFHKLTGNAIRIEGLPDNDAPGVPSLVLNSNLFTSCKAVFAQVGDRPLPGLAAQGNYRDDASAPGNLLFEVPSVGAVQYLTEDAREARDFLRPATAIARSPAPGAIP
jgi:hypothetical protein